MRKIPRNSEEKWWVALYKMQRSQAWHINTVLRKSIFLSRSDGTSLLVLPIPQEHSSVTHHSSEGGRVSAAVVLQKLLLPLGQVKPGLLGLPVTMQFLFPFPPKLRNPITGLVPSWVWFGFCL